MKVLHVAGARPNFVKIAPLTAAFEARGVEAPVVHTGQHYDEKMSHLFFDDLGIPRPKANLEVGSGSHAKQTAMVLDRFEGVLLEEKPDLVIVVGDVNSTAACALAAVKLGIVTAHVEAGLRSFDRTMPEEINRLVTDSICDLLYCSEQSGVDNLRAEGIPAWRTVLVGNVMIDSLLRHRDRARALGMRARMGLPDEYGMLTLHRPSNVDAEVDAARAVETVERVARLVPLVFPVHPRTRQAFARHGLLARLEGNPAVRLIDPLGYLEFLSLLDGARLVLTDSGGVQEETTVLGVPCLTLRPNTERPATVTDGTNRLVGGAPEAIEAAARNALSERVAARRPEFWDGRAAERIADHVLSGVLVRAAAGRNNWQEA
ncbi:MAG: UDP-N-acetylglucosamine 2-epimerase (non-hydrolyzing) [Planctomycetes bacterium]|nr:UDP-N-acetylglucosamine 2-epimerase (non-hydrolyzing) [Planctomycetota bacterium]